MDKHALLLSIANNPNNVSFKDFVRIIEAFGFVQRKSKSGHQIYKRPGVPQLINIQNVAGKAKGYQVRQFLDLIELYNVPFAN
ncbi:MAG: type II toxin-antitoxin system HicA family toxin [Candidatus Kapaibacterium sp.]